MKNKVFTDPLAIKYDHLFCLKHTHKHSYILQKKITRKNSDLNSASVKPNCSCSGAKPLLTGFHFLHFLIRLLQCHRSTNMTHLIANNVIHFTKVSGYISDIT